MHSFFTFLSKKCGKGRLSVLGLQAVFSVERESLRPGRSAEAEAIFVLISFAGAQARRFLTFLLKPVGLLKFRQLYNGLAVFRLGLLCDGCRTHGVLAKHRRQLAAKGFGK